MNKYSLDDPYQQMNPNFLDLFLCAHTFGEMQNKIKTTPAKELRVQIKRNKFFSGFLEGGHLNIKSILGPMCASAFNRIKI